MFNNTIQYFVSVVFYSTSLYLIFFSIIISVIVINVSRNKKTSAVPWFIKKNILEGKIGELFGTTLQVISTDHQQTEELHEAPFGNSKLLN